MFQWSASMDATPQVVGFGHFRPQFPTFKPTPQYTTQPGQASIYNKGRGKYIPQLVNACNCELRAPSTSSKYIPKLVNADQLRAPGPRSRPLQAARPPQSHQRATSGGRLSGRSGGPHGVSLQALHFAGPGAWRRPGHAKLAMEPLRGSFAQRGKRIGILLWLRFLWGLLPPKKGGKRAPLCNRIERSVPPPEW